MLDYKKRNGLRISSLMLDLYMTKELEDEYEKLNEHQLLSLNEQLLEGQVNFAYEMYSEYFKNGNSKEYLEKKKNYNRYLGKNKIYLKQNSLQTLSTRYKRMGITFDADNYLMNDAMYIFSKNTYELELKEIIRDFCIFHYVSSVYLYYRFFTTDIKEGTKLQPNKCGCCNSRLLLDSVTLNTRYTKNIKFNPNCLLEYGLEFELEDGTKSDEILKYIEDNDLDFNGTSIVSFVKMKKRLAKELENQMKNSKDN